MPTAHRMAAGVLAADLHIPNAMWEARYVRSETILGKLIIPEFRRRHFILPVLGPHLPTVNVWKTWRLPSRHLPILLLEELAYGNHLVNIVSTSLVVIGLQAGSLDEHGLAHAIQEG